MVLQERSVQEGQSRRVLPKASWVLLHMVELILTQLVTLRVDQTRRHGPKGHPENFCWQAPSPQDKGAKNPKWQLLGAWWNISAVFCSVD